MMEQEKLKEKLSKEKKDGITSLVAIYSSEEEDVIREEVEQQPKQHAKRPMRKAKTSSTTSLLSRLLEKEIHRESYLTLQCLQFIMDEDFFMNK